MINTLRLKGKSVFNVSKRFYNVEYLNLDKLRNSVHPLYEVNKFSKLQTLRWKKDNANKSQLQNIFIVKKPETKETTEYMSLIITKLLTEIYYKHNAYNIIVQEECKEDLKKSLKKFGYCDETLRILFRFKSRNYRKDRPDDHSWRRWNDSACCRNVQQRILYHPFCQFR
ncbi:unnamed protein product [Hanseniaspora opuntiae]